MKNPPEYRVWPRRPAGDGVGDRSCEDAHSIGRSCLFVPFNTRNLRLPALDTLTPLYPSVSFCWLAPEEHPAALSKSTCRTVSKDGLGIYTCCEAVHGLRMNRSLPLPFPPHRHHQSLCSSRGCMHTHASTYAVARCRHTRLPPANASRRHRHQHYPVLALPSRLTQAPEQPRARTHMHTHGHPQQTCNARAYDVHGVTDQLCGRASQGPRYK